MNKLASVEKIVDIRAIEGSDNIEVVTVLGWNIVVKKGEYNIGDLCSYIQIDTIVPQEEPFEFLRPRGFRVRTIKLRGQISQGLIVPLPIGKYKEGDDLTNILKIEKYSKDIIVKEQAPKSILRKYWWLFKQNILFKLFPSLKPTAEGGSFPSHLVSKTDEERIQNLVSTFRKYDGKTFIVAEKLNGSSITIINDSKKLRVCSRNQEVTNKKDNKFVRVVEDTDFKKYIGILINYYKTSDIIVQGEYIGSPQGNYYKLEKDEIRLFNIIVNKQRINQSEFYAVCQEYNIPHCPYIETYLIRNTDTVENLLKKAEFKSKLNKNVESEGLVFRCIEDNFSFKVVSNKYLIKNEE